MNKVIIFKEALISFSVGPYVGEVVYDVLPMDACHILLSRPCRCGKSSCGDAAVMNSVVVDLRKEIHGFQAFEAIKDGEL